MHQRARARARDRERESDDAPCRVGAHHRGHLSARGRDGHLHGHQLPLTHRPGREAAPRRRARRPFGAWTRVLRDVGAERRAHRRRRLAQPPDARSATAVHGHVVLGEDLTDRMAPAVRVRRHRQTASHEPPHPPGAPPPGRAVGVGAGAVAVRGIDVVPVLVQQARAFLPRERGGHGDDSVAGPRVLVTRHCLGVIAARPDGRRRNDAHREVADLIAMHRGAEGVHVRRHVHSRYLRIDRERPPQGVVHHHRCAQRERGRCQQRETGHECGAQVGHGGQSIAAM